MIDRLTAMEVFATVVDCGSQSAAADQLGLSRPVVSRYLAELEGWIGARLLHRTTRKHSLTPAGTATLALCRQMLAAADAMQAVSAKPDDGPHGLLRLTCSTSLGQAQLAPALVEFIQQHPRVKVDLLLADRAVNLVEERIDLAIRITNALDPNLIARRLTVCRSVVCASPQYLQAHPAPRRPEDLRQHNCLTHSYHGHSLWHFEHAGEPVSVSVPVSGNLSANESMAIMQAAIAGGGIALLPTLLASVPIQAGQLVALLPDAAPEPLGIYGVYTSRKHMPAALRALLDFLAERFPPEPPWDRPRKP